MRYLVAAVLPALLWAGPGGAQSVPAGLSVADRPRPEYRPIGGRLGSFMLYPRLEATAAFDDNIYASENGRESDLVLDLLGGAHLTSLWSRHRLDIGAQYSRTYYLSHGTENHSDAQATIDGTLDFTRATRLRVQTLVGRFTESRRDINSSSNTIAPTQFTRASGRATFEHQMLDFDVSAEAGAQSVTFGNNRTGSGVFVDQGYRNYLFTDALVRLRYGSGGPIAFFGQVSADSLHYRSNTIPVGGTNVVFDRDSKGYRAEVGVSLALTNLLSGNARVGYLTRNNASPLLRDVQGISFGADLLWNVTTLTSLRLVANRSIEESSSTRVAGNLRSEATVTADHELLRNLLLNASARYADIDPVGPLANSQEMEVDLGARYLFSRRFEFRARYENFRRNSSALPEFTDNRFSLGVVGRF